MSLLRRLPCSGATATLLALIAALWAGRAAGLLDLYPALALSPSAVWHGQLWRPLTAPLLASGLLDLLFNAFALVWLTAALERAWRPREWLLYGALCVLVGGLAACALFPRASVIPAGPALLLVGLLVARARLAGGERIHFSPTFSVSAATALLVCAGLILISALASGFPLSGLVALAASAAAGWLYLTLRWRVLRAQTARPVVNGRFERLEL